MIASISRTTLYCIPLSHSVPLAKLGMGNGHGERPQCVHKVSTTLLPIAAVPRPSVPPSPVPRPTGPPRPHRQSVACCGWAYRQSSNAPLAAHIVDSPPVGPGTESLRL
ncbi:hypothetical protein CC80DRAFT_553243 [Byssothecium circinans]|uniref:Uncharacterized protein n=1 Tax=Byssothecium circinans TaxID=147558 RepID=A0A6A5TIW0_9PLEO|nr:hypothetical protein CC80DRAFT_553243 [Byssothecium circinans]